MTNQNTIIEINLPNLRNNLTFLRSKLHSKTLIMAVVKAFSYGSDSSIISKELEIQKVDYLAVAYTNEGIELRESGIKIPILVLHPQLNDFDDILKYELEPSIYSFRVLNAFMDALEGCCRKSHSFQIKFNTGLNRLGFAKTDINNIIILLKGLKPTFIFSHLGASEDSKEYSFTLDQLAAFNEICFDFEKGIGGYVKKHVLNTSGILNFSEYQFDMVRSGIGLYGFGNEAKYTKALRPVIALKTIISQIHIIKKGDSIGYNKGYTALKTLKVQPCQLGMLMELTENTGKEKEKSSLMGHLLQL